MAYSTQEVISDGTLNLLSISIQYLDRSEISVYYDGVLNTTNWSWVGDSGTQIQFSPDVPTGTSVRVLRTTPIDEVLHNFSGGAAFVTTSMDENFEQILHIAQEAVENTQGIADIYNDLDMHGNKVVNIAPGTAAGEAMEYQQVLDLIDATSGATAVAAAAASASAAAASEAAAAGYATAAAGSATLASTAAGAANVSAAASASNAAAAAGSAGLAANYAQLAYISDYGSITGAATITTDYGSIT